VRETKFHLFNERATAIDVISANQLKKLLKKVTRPWACPAEEGAQANFKHARLITIPATLHE
jgi:hypothetical protein